MLFYTTFTRRTFTVSLNELFENYTGRHTHVYSVRMSRLKYPPWKEENTLQSFAGKVTEWPAFWDSFNVTINSNNGISKVDKFKYLLSTLQGDAKESLRV